MRFPRPWGNSPRLDSGTGPAAGVSAPAGRGRRPLVAAGRQLADDFHVVAPDARGHGRSSWNGEAFDVVDLADDVAALIRDIDEGPAHVVGLSMGGCTAVALAVRHPELVGRLVLADTTADYGPGREQAWAERAEKAASVPREKQLDFQVDRWFSEPFRAQDPAEVARVSTIFLATDSNAHAAACRALGEYSDADRLAEIAAPTLVLVGEEDYATPVPMARALHEGIPGSRLEVLAATRHLSLIESAAARGLAREHLLAG